MEGNINGFSKLSKQDKINWIAQTYFSNSADTVELIEQYWNSDEELQKLHDEFIENTITNFYLPFGVAPNFRINDRWYTIPMVIEESSVVAAASKAAKFWSERGGFKTTILGTEKIGQVHFIYKGDKNKLVQFIKDIDSKFYEDTNSITQNMQKRGGGISAIELRDKTADVDNYYQLHVTFETKDSMGANFINSCLEQIAKTLKTEAMNCTAFTEEEKAVDVVMSILSNYVPNCVVRAEVSCPIEDLKGKDIKEPQLFAEKFVQAVRIAEVEPFRAVTHNKGVMNGVDAVVLATGNDFRAIEAGVHAYAARSGQYSSLSHASIENGIFKFWIDLPLALGTVGGLTSLHPMVKVALKMLQSPSATELMQIIAVAGLAQNFAAVKSLTTTGIQQGHMKMHLMNILNQFKATDAERVKVVAHFEKNVVSHSAVVELLESLRK
ncbi:hydroxymethylglutaryl-CoA reductase, degradative [Myroides odoratimimus]|uniref:hydroxymethylglutaryl-CoA reductase, degradative n=1 Tax=Myroides odoratimimus TaxID=76832 RepID=UPI002578195D|nr:hydroxymethylglutaryl-CoA reductase, degradative [Myroides odoratimimus]MDM1401786.1 hydroxymethylglutaryl-CoA reductase, degradative [Myroides odoratimimus]MDM1409634.1 hydroxymethylglutaryl-CoA reductase, degradative [Myroides odoratimimus]